MKRDQTMRPGLARLLRLAAAALATAAAVACGGGDAADASVRQAAAQLDTLVPQWMARTGVPGVAVSVVHGGRTVYARGFGVRRVDEAARVDADTAFPLASVSKSLAATVMAARIPPDAGWDTPIQQLLPTFGLAYPDAQDNARLTLGDLFAHRSGLPDHAGDQLEDLGYGRTEVLARLRHARLNPYGSYAYTNFGLTAAAEALARSLGTDWATLSEQALYQPLGMTHTSSRHADLQARSNRAWGHVQANLSYDSYGTQPARYVVQQPQRQPDAQSPAGGASASAADMARWMALVLAGGRWQGQQLLDPVALQAALAARPGGTYGYGFNVGPDPHGHPSVSHSGAFLLGAHTAFILWPEANLGITVLTNAQPRGLAEAIALAFGELALGDAADGVLTADWLAVMQGRMRGLYQPLGQYAGQPPPETPAPPQPLARYAGRYTNAYYGSAQVTPNADGKTLDLVLGPAKVLHRLRHWSGDSFVFELQGENAPPGSVSAVRFAPDERAYMQIEYYAEDLTRGRFDRDADTP
ncbi:MAG TPA: serine hydrolase [Ottowia sp.]|nr:serine hydrolase [Planctomycetota bacterium]HNE59707.1 serine hydrolase [Ottowia sp.]HNI84181.1 serine hydrolase [Ottowia sp.]HNK52111.1 serine hydrolase [Ottowia sp.]HNN32851.1 serine hydrolase [Ottowia sp.]